MKILPKIQRFFITNTRVNADFSRSREIEASGNRDMATTFKSKNPDQ